MVHLGLILKHDHIFTLLTWYHGLGYTSQRFMNMFDVLWIMIGMYLQQGMVEILGVTKQYRLIEHSVLRALVQYHAVWMHEVMNRSIRRRLRVALR